MRTSEPDVSSALASDCLVGSTFMTISFSSSLGFSVILSCLTGSLSALAEKGFNPEYGARPVKRVIQKEVLNALSKEILAGKVKSDSIILLDAFDDKLVFRNQGDLVNEM